jgi:hypothetical protein
MLCVIYGATIITAFNFSGGFLSHGDFSGLVSCPDFLVDGVFYVARSEYPLIACHGGDFVSTGNC